MNKTLIKFIIGALIVYSYNANAQTLNCIWANSANGNIVSNTDSKSSIAVDANGNSYVVGYFKTASITFGSTTLTNASSSGYSDMFIVKYDVNGSVAWAKSAGGSFRDEAVSIGIDASNNCYVTGKFGSPTITFGSTTLTNVGGGSAYEDMFLVKYNSSGTVLWAKSAGSNYFDSGNAIVVDGSGNSYVTGHFDGASINFGAFSLTNSNTAYAEMFIVKYNSSGNVVWATNPNGGLNDDIGNDIALDASGNIYVTGYFRSSVITFGSTTLTNTAASNDVFIVKYNSSGTVVWAKKEGWYSDDFGNSINVDASGFVYVAGHFTSGSITFGSTTLNNTTTNGKADMFLVKYNSSGTVIWAKSAGGVEIDICLGIDGDSNGNTYITGVFQSHTINFGGTILTNTTNNSYGDIFCVKYNSSGVIIWANSFGGNSNDMGNEIAISANSDIFLTGFYGAPSINFGNITLPTTQSGIYTAKLSTITGLQEFQNDEIFSVSPNPFTTQTTITFSREQNNAMIKIIDVLGKEIKLDAFEGKNYILQKGDLHEGIYFIIVYDDDKTVVSKKIVIQ